ncbi:MAG: hypothetical protein J6Y90_07470 [Lachnospiraceae bacterium]|nr:hypothetical protein [Lachnospiraceae bacterium]
MYGYECRTLNFQLVPEKAWSKNLRSLIPNWHEVSFHVRMGGECSVCGKMTGELEAHEIWDYDDKTHEQTLRKIVPVCPDCHNAIRVEHACQTGTFNEALEQYMKVNGIDIDEAYSDLEEARKVWQERSLHEWKLDEEKLKEKVTALTGISCEIDKPINGRYYANVPYELKDTAKEMGAKWDNLRKMWYFASQKTRSAWQKKYGNNSPN